jgi:hypothetical protein
VDVAGQWGHHDYPWYGRTYNCALEPFTSWPPAGIKNAIENDTARLMEAGEVIDTDLVAVAYEGSRISRVGRLGRDLSGRRTAAKPAALP